MTKEEVIKNLIDMAKNGVTNPLDAYCDSCSCLTCPFHNDEIGECSDQMVGELIGRLIKAEEHQETNLEHYIVTYQVDDGEGVFWIDKESKMMFDGVHDLQVFVKWLLQPYEPQKYKLTQFEYDLLRVHAEEVHPGCIHHYWELKGMCGKGYFKGLPTDVPIKDIFDNCEVVDE